MAKIVVIEDNPVNMKLAALLLRNVGHTVLCAIDAETGLTLARKETPDLVLMDFQLPGMDGLTATALLRRDPLTAAIPVIALTALSTKENQEKSRSAGCAAFIAKPLRYQELYAAIDSVLTSGVWRAADYPAPPHPAAAINAANPGPTVDVDVLRRLIGDNPAVVLEFLREFRVSAAKIAATLKVACNERRASLVARQSHMLKSAAYSVGARGLGELCAAMEIAGNAGNVELLTDFSAKFAQEFDAVNAFLDAFDPPPANDSER